MNDEPRKDDPIEENADAAVDKEELVEAFMTARKEIMEDNPDVTDAMADDAPDRVSILQDEVDDLRFTLDEAAARIVELEAPVAPAGDAELRALAVTVRTAQRNGHPDAVKHINALLRALGA